MVPAPAPVPLPDAPAPAEHRFWSRKLTRRAAAGGIVTIGAGSALGGLAWWRRLGSPVSADILAMMEHSRQLLGQNTREG